MIFDFVFFFASPVSVFGIIKRGTQRNETKRVHFFLGKIVPMASRSFGDTDMASDFNARKAAVLRKESWLPGSRPGEPDVYWSAIRKNVKYVFSEWARTDKVVVLNVPEKMRIPIELFHVGIRNLEINIMGRDKYRYVRDEDHPEYVPHHRAGADEDHTRSTWDVINGIASNGTVEGISVSGARVIDDEMTVALARAIKANTRMSKFTLDVRFIDDTDVVTRNISRAVFDGLRDNPTSNISTLGLIGFDVHDIDSRAMLQFVFTGDTLVRHLKLSLIDNTGNGFSGLETLIKDTTTLISLNLSRTRLLDAGLKHVFDGMSRNRSIVELNVSITNFGEGAYPVDHAGRSLGRFLMTNHTIGVLNMGGVKLSDTALVLMMDGLTLNSTLKKLVIWGCIPDTEGAADAVERYLKATRVLRELDISATTFDRDAAESIGDGLKENRSIGTVFIGPDTDGSLEQSIRDYETGTLPRIVDPIHGWPMKIYKRDGGGVVTRLK